MMTDQEVAELYRCLLARAPENPDTVAAFKAYYETVERGRQAILGSPEFRTAYARSTGRVLDAGEHVAATLALALLRRAAGPSAVADSSGDHEIAAGLRLFFDAASTPPLAVAVGQPLGVRLDDLAPFGGPEAAVLHVASGFPPAAPQLGALQDGTSVFRLGMDAAGVADLLKATGRSIDALYLLDCSAGPGWVDALRGHFAPRTLLVLGPAQDGFDPDQVAAGVRAAHHCERVLHFGGLQLHQVGGWMLPVTYAPPAAPPPPVRGAYPALAIAAIVRDEAVCVGNMLESTRAVASFHAVLDTGSADATPAIVQDFLAGSGVPWAYAQRDHAAFGDDFAAMRNAALAMVPDWVEWVLMLDADEELSAEDLTPMLDLLAAAEQTPGCDAFALPRYNFAGADKSGTMLTYPDRQVRLLRNTPDHRVRYTGAVHETVSTGHASLPSDASALGLSRGGPHIHHLVRRFRTPEEEERKQAFYREIAARRGFGGGRT